MAQTRASQIAQHLSYVLRNEGPASLQFNNQFVFDQEVRRIMSKQSPIFVEHFNGMLLSDAYRLFAKAMGKGVFVDLFEVTAPEIAMYRKASLADD